MRYHFETALLVSRLTNLHDLVLLPRRIQHVSDTLLKGLQATVPDIDIKENWTKQWVQWMI